MRNMRHTYAYSHLPLQFITIELTTHNKTVKDEKASHMPHSLLWNTPQAKEKINRKMCEL